MRKALFWLSTITATILFGDQLAIAIAHGFILSIECIELLFEHMIESVFHVDARLAQIITAWCGLLSFLGLAFLTGRYIKRVMLRWRIRLRTALRPRLERY